MAHGLAIYMDVQFSSWKCSKKERERNERKEGTKRKERKKRKEEEEKRKERRKKGKEEGNRNQCRAGSGTRLQRTWNCSARGRFPPTPIILCLGAT